MSVHENKFGREHLSGNADLPLISTPTIRGSIRRADPDGGHSAPYFNGLTGTSLTVTLQTVGDLVLSFASDDYQTTLGYINTVSPTNLQAEDQDGYLVLTDLNSGDKNYMMIKSGDAAPILGFAVDPLPGAFSFAGDSESASPGRQRSQDNPHGTALLAADEDLTTRVFNRALFKVSDRLERLLRELDREVATVYSSISVTVSVHTGSGGEKVFGIPGFVGIRFPIIGLGFIGTSPPDNELDCFATLLDATTEEPVLLLSSVDEYARITNVYYEDISSQSAALDDSASFTVWGTPDGKSIFGPDVSTKLKHPSTAITTIDGNVIEVSGATFQTLNVRPGDTVLIENATNTDPFNHDGEYIVEEVLSEELLSVRAKGNHDSIITDTDGDGSGISGVAYGDRPKMLNINLPGSTVYGDLSVLIGYFVSGDELVFQVSDGTPTGPYKVRLASGARLKDLQPASLVRSMIPSLGSIAAVLRGHLVTDVGYRHDAEDVDAPAVVGSPDSLALGTVEEQLAELLNHLNTLIAGQVTYAGGPAWADDTLNSGAGYPKFLEAQIDKNLGELAAKTDGDDGAAKIGAEAVGDLAEGTLRAQLDQLDTEWLRLARNNTVSGANQFTGSNTFTIMNTFANNQRVAHGPDPRIPGFLTTYSPEGGYDRKLMWQALITITGDQQVRFYAVQDAGDTTGGWELTVNCSYDTTVWSCDDNSKDAVCYRFESEDLKVLRHIATASTWLDNAWSTTPLNLEIDYSSGLGRLLLAGYLRVSRDAYLDDELILGEGLLGTLSNATTPRINVERSTQASAPTGYVRTLISKYNASGGPTTRVYLEQDIGTGDDFLWLCYNCYWNSTTELWVRDKTTGFDSRGIQIGPNTFLVHHQPEAGADSWADGAWSTYGSLVYAFEPTTEDSRLSLKDGYFSVTNPSVSDDGGNPAYNVAMRNRQAAKNITKMWGYWRYDTSAFPNIQDGFNIDDGSGPHGDPPLIAGGDFVVGFMYAMADDNYVAHATIENHFGAGTQKPYIVHCIAKTSTSCTFRLWLPGDDGTTGFVNQAGLTSDYGINVTVIGKQS